MTASNWIGRDPTSGMLVETRQAFLGPLAADPVAGMIIGDTYFNTVSFTLRSYNGTAWQTDGGGSSASQRTFAFFAG